MSPQLRVRDDAASVREVTEMEETILVKQSRRENLPSIVVNFLLCRTLQGTLIGRDECACSQCVEQFLYALKSVHILRAIRAAANLPPISLCEAHAETWSLPGQANEIRLIARRGGSSPWRSWKGHSSLQWRRIGYPECVLTSPSIPVAERPLRAPHHRVGEGRRQGFRRRAVRYLLMECWPFNT
jgi:hypothetical protein